MNDLVLYRGLTGGLKVKLNETQSEAISPSCFKNMKRIEQINARLRQIELQKQSGVESYHDLLRLEKEKEELEKELEVLIKTNK